MAEINLALKEIYSELCPECKAKLRELVKGKLADQVVKEALEGDKK